MPVRRISVDTMAPANAWRRSRFKSCFITDSAPAAANCLRTAAQYIAPGRDTGTPANQPPPRPHDVYASDENSVEAKVRPELVSIMALGSNEAGHDIGCISN